MISLINSAAEVTAEHGLDVVHFDFVGGWVLKNQVVINQVKIPFLPVCSSKSNKPAFEVRFLAENSILLITSISSFRRRFLCLKILTSRFNRRFSFSSNG